MGYEAKVICDSISRGHRLTTMQITFPRFILAEFNTHRMFSKNSASSRAIPVEKRIAQVEADPFVPLAFGKNQRGMQAGEELDAKATEEAIALWREGAARNIEFARGLSKLGVHKQWANRFIELFSWHTVVVTATDWSNYDALRDSAMASPEIAEITRAMKKARSESKPFSLGPGEWHLPYITHEDVETATVLTLRKMSVSRCAAVSYLRQEERDPKKEIERYEMLKNNGHNSPFEHCARPMDYYEYTEIFTQKKVIWNEDEQSWTWVGLDNTGKGEFTHYCGNLNGWIQERKMIPNEDDFSKIAPKT